MKTIHSLALCAALASAFAAPAAMARDGADGKPLVCINLMSMGETPVIDERTILVKMKTGDAPYKRIDLAGPCNGIEYKGFAHHTSYNELCSSDTLDSLATGSICKIDQITNLSSDEGKALLSHKK